MSIDTYLRLMVQADKEGVITAQHFNGPGAEQFTTQLTSGQTRKSLSVYNNSDSASGESYYGYTESVSPSGESMVIPIGALVTIPVADTTAIPIYFSPSSGEMSDLRIEELA